LSYLGLGWINMHLHNKGLILRNNTFKKA
jgi:hypothetical protein